MIRSWSTLEIRSVDAEQRRIVGIASTPSVDSYGDIVEPLGVEFDLPIPFLWQHRHDEPIGHVIRAQPTRTGIEVTIQLAQTDEPGTLKDRLDECWQSIKLGLVRGLSVGFQSLEAEWIEGGRRFIRWLWVELSAVTIPANSDATVTAIKRADAQFLPRTKPTLPARRREAPPRPKSFSMHGAKFGEDEILETIKGGQAATLTPEVRQHFVHEIAAVEQARTETISTTRPPAPAVSASTKQKSWTMQMFEGWVADYERCADDDIAGLFALADATGVHVQDPVAALSFMALSTIHRIKREKLEARVAELENARSKAADSVVYRGVYDRDETYYPGDIATHGGTLWFCHEQTTDRPGTKSWQLMVKTR